jgi:hypothetical protein
MAHNGQRIEFPTLQAMTAHLDRWAATSLTSPEQWEDALVGSRSWLDYSARNQVLLASYGIDGPVAGPETWRLVPSTTEGRGCAIRAGEHGYPVRVPITSGGTEPDPYLGGHRPTRAAVERWEWRPVFETAQLARRPAPGALSAIDTSRAPPRTERRDRSRCRGPQGRRRHHPRTAPSHERPERLLSDAAVRLRRSHKRPALDETLAGQAAWLVLDRVGHAPTDLAEVRPGALDSRERWERLQDVLEPARKLTAALGVTVGVDLTASPLPRMEILDDRVVPAGRRHRLPAASLEQLPIGRWVTVGPYTATEWSARGEHASGSGAFLRLNKTAYLAAVETGDGATWRLEDIAARTGNGAPRHRKRPHPRRRPRRSRRCRPRSVPGADRTDTDTGPSPAGAVEGWEQMPRAGRPVAAELWHLTNDITLYVLPAPGGRWQPALQTPSTDGLELLPLQPTQQDAREQAELAGRRVARMAMIADPATSDRSLAAFADDGLYNRADLAHLISGRLTDADTARVPDADPAELVELLGAAGFSPATTVAVLAADGVDAATAATSYPQPASRSPTGYASARTLGPPQHARGRTPRRHRHEMRTAGCTNRDHGRPPTRRPAHPPRRSTSGSSPPDRWPQQDTHDLDRRPPRRSRAHPRHVHDRAHHVVEPDEALAVAAGRHTPTSLPPSPKRPASHPSTPPQHSQRRSTTTSSSTSSTSAATVTPRPSQRQRRDAASTRRPCSRGSNPQRRATSRPSDLPSTSTPQRCSTGSPRPAPPPSTTRSAASTRSCSTSTSAGLEPAQ